MIDCFAKFCHACFERYKDQVKYWLTFNEVDSVIRHPFTTAGIIPSRVPEDKMLETCYQALHHQLVASAMVVKDCHEIIPGSKVGCMLTKLTTYARTCAPMMSWLLRQRIWKTCSMPMCMSGASTPA